MIKLRLQVISQILWLLNHSLDSVVVVAMAAKAVAAPQGTTLFNVSYATSRAT